MTCDWCEGAGCEECQGTTKGGGGGGGVCDWCEGAGCDECGAATIHTDGKKAAKKTAAADCDWCGGEGCENCTGSSESAGGGVCDFCDGSGCDACQPKEKNKLSTDVQIANTFYEAESEMKDNPKKALSFFQEVLNLAKADAGSINDESNDTVFRSLVHMVVLHFKANNEKEMLSTYRDVLDYFPKVSHNESNKGVDTVLNAMMAAGKSAQALRDKVYDLTIQELAKMPNKARMIFDIQMRRATEYVSEKDFPKATNLLGVMHASCRTRDGQDDKQGKGSELIDIYALEMKIAFEAKVKAKTKELYMATKDLRVDVKNPKSQAIIRECWGKMFGDDGQWPKAYAEFFVAFTTYQEAGQSGPAKKCLTYVVIASMLAGTGLNPFDAREAAVFQKDEAMQPVINLRRAYEKRDVPSFTKALAEFQASADDWILAHMDSMIADFHKQYILKFVKPYRRLRVSFLANALQIKEETCESYLVQLVLDGLIHAKIDQVNGLLDLTQRTGGGDKKYQALEGWAGKLESMGRNLPQPHSSSSMHMQFF